MTVKTQNELRNKAGRRGVLFEVTKPINLVSKNPSITVVLRLLQIVFMALLLGVMMGSCAYTEKVKDGQTAFERRQYAVAIPMLAKSYGKAKRKTEQGQLAFLIGECYRRTNRPSEAISWYRTAYDYQYGVEALRQYALMLKENGQYADAIEAFRELGIEIGSPYEYRKEINSCEIAGEWLKKNDESGYRVIPAGMNTPAAEYAPTFLGDSLVIVSDRSSSLGEDPYTWTGRDFSDLFQVEDETAVSLPEPLNSTFNEGPASFRTDGKEVFLTRCSSPGKFEDGYCKIWQSTFEDNAWTEPEPLPFQLEGINYGHPSLSADGLTLFFACNDPAGWGGFDIYVSTRSAGGEWSAPQIMSRSINTQHDELFPWIDADTLYFASDGHTGMGGLDIFSSFRFQDDWTPAYNLRPPLNSSSDDFGFIIDRRGKAPEKNVLQEGFLVSSRPLGEGDDDIFEFQKVRPEEPEKEQPVEAEWQPMVLNVYVLEKIYLEPGNPNSRVLGRKPLQDALLQINQEGTETAVTIGPDGRYILELEENADYTFTASKAEYLTNLEQFSTKGIARDPRNAKQVFELELVLDKIFLDQEIVLEDIYYDFDEWEIREDARPTLLELAEMLMQNPGIRIQLSSHTDCRGSARYNEDLSRKRAQSAVDFLITSGINAARLEAVGYGESSPAVDCICTRCTEEEHQANRRTTFKVLE